MIQSAFFIFGKSVPTDCDCLLKNGLFVTLCKQTSVSIYLIYPANSGPDILFLLLKAPTNNWAPSSPTRLTSWALSSSIDFCLTISCRSTGLNPALSKRSRVAPKRTLSLSAFSVRSDSIFNALGAISAKLRCNSSVISSAYSLSWASDEVVDQKHWIVIYLFFDAW